MLIADIKSQKLQDKVEFHFKKNGERYLWLVFRGEKRRDGFIFFKANAARNFTESPIYRVLRPEMKFADMISASSDAADEEKSAGRLHCDIQSHFRVSEDEIS